ncbi:hypothetical protein C8A05DRAFT_36338, partial [Staphylotrichum tortipilum]
MADQGSGGDDPNSSRPSFAGFWNKSKDALGARRIRFVESNPGGGGGDSSGTQDGAPAGAALDKAQLRRAQVRKAQTQHRQRKANYVKQLEMDVARIRDMMEAAERDTRSLIDENKLMRTRIQHAITSKAVPLSLDQRVSILREIPEPAQLSGATTESVPAPQDSEPVPVTVTLGFDEVINAPAFYISSPPPTAVPSQQPSKEPSPNPVDDDGLPELTPTQTHAAINFILA